MKVTIRSVNAKLWEEAKIEAIKRKLTLGELINLGLRLLIHGELPPTHK